LSDLSSVPCLDFFKAVVDGLNEATAEPRSGHCSPNARRGDRVERRKVAEGCLQTLFATRKKHGKTFGKDRTPEVKVLKAILM
jgi:hypothetical protein